MATKKKTNKNSFNNQSWYAIMLDYEVDLVNGYWPLRSRSLSLEALKKEMWINGNPSLLPSDSHEAIFIQSKGLADKISKREHSGGIYRFRPITGG